MQKIKVAIVDEHELSRTAIVQSIQSEKNIEVVHETDNGGHFIDALKSLLPDILLVEAKMAETEHENIVDHLHANHPQLGIVVFSENEITHTMVEMNIHRVRSFIEKANREQLLKAVRMVYDGGIYMTDRIDSVTKEYLVRLNRKRLTAEKADAEVRNTLSTLSEIEGKILNYLPRGYTSREIGERVFLSHRTVEKHVNHIYQKFNVRFKHELLEKVYALLEV